MGLACKRLERCHQCPPRAPRVQCWWTVTDTGPWRLCHGCYQWATGQAPS